MTKTFLQCKLLLLSLSTFALTPPNEHLSDNIEDKKSYLVNYVITLNENSDDAEISIKIADTQFLKYLDFNLIFGDYQNFQGNGSLTLKNNRARWVLPSKNAALSFSAKIPHERGNNTFDALITKTYAIFRGDDLIPPVRAVFRGNEKISSIATLAFKLPTPWKHINSGWPRIEKNTFLINNPSRFFDRPTGWMVAGSLGTRRARLGHTDVSVSAPIGHSAKRLDALTFLTFIWPTLTDIFKTLPPKILMVSAGNPMWKGALSASNSFFMHADRPLVSENGTSTLIHELIHTISGITAAPMDDWITEGLAEYYAIEILFRAGGMSEARRATTKAKLDRWSKDVSNIRTSHSTGATTAKAALLFDALDQEIRRKTRQAHSLDTITRQLMQQNKASLTHLQALTSNLLNEPSEVLQSSLLKLADYD